MTTPYIPHSDPNTQFTPQPGNRQKVIYAILAVLLGCFGVHNFYLGYHGRGVAQLLITVLTFGIGSIITFPWVIAELIITLTADPGTPWNLDADGRTIQ